MSFIDRLRSFRTKQTRIVKISWLGLDHAGKSTIIKRITQGIFSEESNRTLGLNVDQFTSESVKFLSWDVGGQIAFRDSLWNDYVVGSAGIIFVVDSTDVNRFIEARQELWKYIITNPKIHQVPILIIANKQDLPAAKSAGEVARALNLQKVIDRSYAIFPTSAATGFNLNDAIDWLRQRITEKL